MSFRKVLFFDRYRQLEKAIEDYHSTDSTHLQVNRFNEIWKSISLRHPYYMRLKERYGLPDAIKTVEELKNFPVLSKAEINKNKELFNRDPRIIKHTYSGGTSGQTTLFPVTNLDVDKVWANAKLGKYLNHLNDGERILRIWGHGHLSIGTKAHLTKILMKFARRIITNTFELSAYNIDHNALTSVLANCKKTRPKIVISYGSILYQLAKFNLENQINTKLNYIINTSETLTASEAELISESFQATLINEYGMAETGPVGYSTMWYNHIDVFRSSFLVTETNNRIHLSTLWDKGIPLINYDTQDVATDFVTDNGSVQTIIGLQGKERPLIELGYGKNKISFSSIALDHIAKQIPGVLQTSYVVGPRLKILVKTSKVPTSSEESQIKKIFLDKLNLETPRKISPQELYVECRSNLATTIAGKRKIIVEEVN